jgi:hypothetical protein
MALALVKPIDKLIVEIRGHMYDALSTKANYDKYRQAAGQTLLELRRRVEAGEAGEGVNWWQWFEANVERSRKDCEKLMKLAAADDPELTFAEERERVRIASAKSRARRMLPTSIEVIEDDDGEEEPPPRQLPDSMRVRGFLHRAKESAQMARDDDLAGLKITKAMRAAVEDAAAAWGQLLALIDERASTLPQDGRSEGRE